jgi:multicomponent Na+:H+ antiporter subunit F
MFTIFLGIIVGLIVISFIRMFIGPTVWDRLLIVSVITSKFIVFFVILSIVLDLDYLVDVSFAYGLLASIEIIFLTQFIKSKGKI